MTRGDIVAEDRYGRIQVLRSLGLVVLGILIMFLISRFTNPLSVDLIWIQYPIDQDPNNQSVLIVERNKNTRLRHAGTEQVVRSGTFQVDNLFQQLLGQLVNTWDEDKRVDRPLGTVRIWFSDKTSGTYLIYDENFAEELFTWARTRAADGP